MQLPVNEGVVFLEDIILSAAGTDTTTADIFANARFTGDRIQNSANLATNVSRQFFGAPIPFKPGASVKIKQNT